MRTKLFWAALLCFAAALLAGRGASGAALLACAALLLGCGDWRSLVEFGSLKFWLPLLLFVLLSPLFIGKASVELLGRPYSLPQLAIGLGLLSNAYVFMTLTAYAGRNFSFNQTVSAAEKYGGKTIGLRIALVLASAGMIRRSLSETWLIYSAQRDWRRLAAELPVFMSAALRNTALKAEQIAVLFFIRNTGV